VTEPGAAPAIRTDGLTRRFGAVTAVDDISYEVPWGAISGLIGPNGAGKTTLLSLLCGYLRPSAGGGTVLGHRFGELPALKGRLGVFPQDASLNPRRPVVHQLALWAELSGMSRAEAVAAAKRALERVGLADRARDLAGTLSHGMAKRAGIAAAFMGAPELVLLDEPTAGLDPRSAHQIRSLYSALRGRATVVVSSHNLQELQEVCDHATIVDRGRIVAQGPLDDITVADTEVRISLAPSSAPPPSVEALAALDGVTGAELTEDGRSVLVRFVDDPARGVEVPLAAVLRHLLDAEALISEIHRGRSLEERFLELTST
jgi:ABC-2 type transport system ATP-binding protein